MTTKPLIRKIDNYMTIFLTTAICLLSISIAFPFIVNHYFSNWTTSGTFGDTFGALNALFSGLAFAAIIVTIQIQRKELKNQQMELQLQRTEMQETRKEFLINRATSIVYNQLDRFEKCLSMLTINHNGQTYIGNDAISLLYHKREIVYHPVDKPEAEYNAEKKALIIKLLKFYIPNKSHIEKFAHSAYNSVEALKRLIFKTNLEIEDLNDLKNLFYVNIGFVNMSFIEEISDLALDELKFLENKDYMENNFDVCEMMRAAIFLKPIKEFYELRLTKENFEEQKSKWIISRGNEG